LCFVTVQNRIFFTYLFERYWIRTSAIFTDIWLVVIQPLHTPLHRYPLLIYLPSHYLWTTLLSYSALINLHEFCCPLYDAISKSCLDSITANNSIRKRFRGNWP